MRSFNYLSDPLETALGGWRVPEHLQAPARVLACCVIFACVSLSIEAVRLQTATQNEKTWAQKYAAQTALFRDASAYARRVAAVMALDQQVRRIAESGTKAALRIGAMTRDLPLDVWLTSLTPAGDGLDVEGSAESLDAVRRALVRFAGDRAVGEPRLSRAATTGSGPASVRFSLHLGERAP